MLVSPFLAAATGGAFAIPLLVLLYVAALLSLSLVYPLTAYVLSMSEQQLQVSW